MEATPPKILPCIPHSLCPGCVSRDLPTRRPPELRSKACFVEVADMRCVMSNINCCNSQYRAMTDKYVRKKSRRVEMHIYFDKWLCHPHMASSILP
ncbi:hypothetical protein Y032_1303g3813 [Ancylostoma ceylanicum]|uniref:Uncharacterized protein n=1 Tax=Ancylostoma ceylanicum TaxID=53326 RepID=A0A016W7A6_9BILA|nr:hypothetical protein Y032_1303g3813 [Ancylostoma ceylanicum]